MIQLKVSALQFVCCGSIVVVSTREGGCSIQCQCDVDKGVRVPVCLGGLDSEECLRERKAPVLIPLLEVMRGKEEVRFILPRSSTSRGTFL